jgi:hypothetical protein
MKLAINFPPGFGSVIVFVYLYPVPDGNFSRKIMKLLVCF